MTSAFEINLVASETNPAKKPIVVNMDQDLNMEVSDFLIPEKLIERQNGKTWEEKSFVMYSL